MSSAPVTPAKPTVKSIYSQSNLTQNFSSSTSTSSFSAGSTPLNSDPISINNNQTRHLDSKVSKILFNSDENKEEKKEAIDEDPRRAHNKELRENFYFDERSSTWEKSLENFRLLPPENYTRYVNNNEKQEIFKKYNKVQIGNSDDDISDSENEENLRLCIDKPIKPKMTTIVCSEKSKIKGDEIITIIHKMVAELYFANIFQNLIIFTDKLKQEPQQMNNGTDFFASAGRCASSHANSEIECDETNLFQNLIINPGNLKVKIVHNKIKGGNGKSNERIYNDDDDLKKLVINYFSYYEKHDYSFKQIFHITKKIMSIFKLDDKSFAKIQLEFLKGNHKENNKTYLRKWISFLNALIFGVEASRVNNIYVIGIMGLELIVAGKMTYKEAFFDDEFGGQMPFASNFTGSKNYSMRAKMIKLQETGKPTGFSYERRNVQWLAVSVKEVLIVKKWLKFKKVLSRDETKENQIKNIENVINKNIFDVYYKYALISGKITIKKTNPV